MTRSPIPNEVRSAKVAALLRRSDELTASIDLALSLDRCEAAVDRLLSGTGPNETLSVHSYDENDRLYPCECYRLEARVSPTWEAVDGWAALTISYAAVFGCGIDGCGCEQVFVVNEVPSNIEEERVACTAAFLSIGSRQRVEAWPGYHMDRRIRRFFTEVA